MPKSRERKQFNFLGKYIYEIKEILEKTDAVYQRFNGKNW